MSAPAPADPEGNRGPEPEWDRGREPEWDRGREPEWEYAPLRLPPDVSRVTATVRLALHAEYGGWELARVQRYVDGTRRVVLRRKRRPGTQDLPLPGLLH